MVGLENAITSTILSVAEKNKNDKILKWFPRS
jgi:hypothetical protein